ncbi:antirestriction protein [Listeria floridensis FSL S10-1187]|uniref:Antirestriction protein n=1 Tax=Listeria floridensis FSL S10-1187 TaxID=1265817 RepID=A0ABN0RGS4_9LIST|nr:antirestriction protein ArdA [Listeria floridensis]EUJ33126.1 antirestriction protein [Listeria floridensis FSL S10-1187]
MSKEFRLLIRNSKSGKSGWFDVPINYNKLASALALNDEYEHVIDEDNYLIEDYESPLRMDRLYSIEEFDQIATYYEEYSHFPCIDELDKLVLDGYYGSLIEAFENIENIEYIEPMTRSDLARYLVEELDLLSGVPEAVVSYFDYSAYGRDLELSGDYSQLDSGAWVAIR